VSAFAAEIAAARDLLRAAAADGAAVLPCGRRSRLARHAPDARPDRWLELDGLRGIVRLDAEDQTCEVGAGTAPAELDAELAPHGLMLAVDAPCAVEGTLGGLMLAPDLSLLHRAYGPPRDQVLGGRWLLADGAEVRTGARVVKSVAGYDLTRLFLGSRGRLAACITLTLRLQPRPRALHTYRVLSPPLLRTAAVPDPVWFFQPRAGAAYAAWDGIEPAHATLAPCPLEEFATARVACLSAFAALPVRWAFAGAPERAPDGACDWNALQAGARAGESPATGAVRTPPIADSLWLPALAAACAPDAPPFGTRTPAPR
jgi:FAD/FMN-containing dehydrogenase